LGQRQRNCQKRKTPNREQLRKDGFSGDFHQYLKNNYPILLRLFEKVKEEEMGRFGAL
jgi:hypothetical protein